MNPNQPSSAPTLGPREILVIVFRNKWTIILCSLLGVGAACTLYFLLKPLYESSADVYVRYVVEQPAGVPGDTGLQVKSADARGDGLIATEASILGSWDLALGVSTKVGPAEVLGQTKSTNLLYDAALNIRKNLMISPASRGSVVNLTYANRNPAVAQQVLQVILEVYKEKHIQAHSSAGMYESLVRETELMSARIKENQGKLTQLRDKLGVTTLAETKSQLAAQILKLEEAIVDVKAELAQSEARLFELQKNTGGTVTTNQIALDPQPVDEKVLQKYRGILARIERFRANELDLLGQYTQQNPLVMQLRQQIVEAETDKESLEALHPGLLLSPRVSARTASGSSTGATVDLSLERASISALQARLKTLVAQHEELVQRRSLIAGSEDELTDLQRKLALDEKAYQDSLVDLRGARFSEALDPAKMPNINVIQNPSMPVKAAGKRLKICAGAAFAGFALGLGLAFLRELVFDQSIRGPLEIEAKFQLPMFMSIPLLADRQPVRLLTDGAGDLAPIPGAHPARAPWEISHFIRPYCDALRDRLIMYFQLKNIHHKPKLVAVTSCSEGAGATTVAAALAASLSETGDGKVLLVDMNVARPEMHPFFRGNLASSLTDLFQPGMPPGEGQYRNLYLATGTERNGEKSPLLPTKFYEMLPRMRSSDFDYIIFDMPAVKQTTATVALSGFMDKVLLMIEPGKTNREAVKRATELMRQQHADVAGVVNRLPESAPKWLQPELA